MSARRAFVPVLLVVLGVGLFVGGIGLWAERTLYDSDAFAGRVTSILRSSDVRHEAAERLTEELVRNGNQQAIAFRPAFEAGIESALNTDTFRAIFRGAIRMAHADLLRGGHGGAGINLSESVAVVANTLQLSGSDPGQALDRNSFAESFTDVSQRIGDIGVWELQETIRSLAAVALALAIGAAVAAVALASNRRRAIWWIGWTVAAVGVFTVVLLWLVGWVASRQISDPGLAGAVRGAIRDMTGDLRTMALWTIAYGVIVAGAAATAEHRSRAGDVLARGRDRVTALRRTTAGSLLVAAVAVVLGFLVLANPLTAAEVLAVLVGMGLTYVGTVEIVGMVRRVSADRARSAWWRPVLLIASVVVLLGAATAAVVVTTSRSAQHAVADAGTACNGSDEFCDLRLDEMIFPATHNSMSSALYSGWLFGEQIGTIHDQLNAGIRALLIDTHYGIPSSARMPGSQTNVVITDRAAELSSPDFEQADPAVVERANALAERAPAAAGAKRQIYLCHNYCELGAVAFSDVLARVGAFIDANPREVIVLDIQDATSPADTAQAFVDAGLEDRIAVLEPGQPLPTLGELIDARTNLVVFAERGGTGAPPWYQSAYNGWLQETKYTFSSVADFDCAPNRGGTDGALFLVNHWVTTAGPSPSTARNANRAETLLPRLEACIRERGRLPNLVAVDYAQASPLVQLMADHGDDLRDLLAGKTPPATSVPSTTSMPSDAVTTLTGGDADEFCAAVPAVLTSVTAYAEALLSQPAAGTAAVDVLYAPWLAATLAPYVAAAPQELAAEAQPLLTRSQQALAAVGLDADAATQLATVATRAAADATADGVTLQDQLQSALLQRVSQAELDAAATTLGPAQGDLFALVDLGSVSQQVALANGYDCLRTATSAGG